MNCAVCARTFDVPQYVADRLLQLGIDKAPCCENCLRCGFAMPSLFSLKENEDSVKALRNATDGANE
jgi:copper oxidase (laccase) domain-containing protein